MGERQRILVVDDQPEILDLALAVLSEAGFEVETAASGAGALGRVAGEPFDLVLLDINMPLMDGWETLRLLRADESLDGLPVVMFSVKGEVADQIESLKEGAAGHITKPFVVDEFVARIRRALEASPRRTRGSERGP